MRRTQRRELIQASLVALAVLTAYTLSFIKSETMWVPLHFARSGIYLALFIAWGVSVNRRVIHPQIRRLFAAVTVLMVFWMTMRTVKFSLNPGTLERYCWYLYYIPLLYIPLITTLIAAYQGRPEEFQLPPWTRLLNIAAAAIALLVLTNDWHRLVFVFPPGKPIATTDYSYGPGFLLPAAWNYGGTLTTLALVFARSHVPGRTRRLLAPIIPAVLLTLYHLIYILEYPWLREIFGDMTVTQCLLIICILEGCMRTGLIRTNIRYAELFRLSGVRAVIVDDDYAESIASETYTPLPAQTLQAAEREAVILPGAMRLSEAPIKNGHVLWQEDVSEIYGLLEALHEVNERLAEDNDLLAAENEMKKRQARVAEQDRLYDKVTREVLPQLQALDELLRGGTALCAREQLKKLCVYGTYIKRRCNLLILREDKETCPAKELEYCMRESCEALTAIGVDCAFRRSCEGEMPTHTAVMLYDLLEGLIEAMLPDLGSLLLNLQVRDGQTELKLLADHAEPLPARLTDGCALCGPGDTWRVTREDGVTSVVLRLTEGGAAV